jgi:DNA-binding MarR family transcriptional regulator
MSDSHPLRHASVAFLLAQVGAAAARQFSKALEPLQLAPSDAGIMRLLARSPGVSQQELAKRLDMHASRLVGVIDALEKRGLLHRKPNEADRRVYSLHLSPAGQQALAAIAEVARSHNESVCSALGETERDQLRATLEKIAAHMGLQTGVHPGYRDLGEKKVPAKEQQPDSQ